MAASSRSIRYSLVIPVFNEEAVLPVLLRRLDQVMSRLDGPAEAIFVDDGSRDSSPIVLRALAARYEVRLAEIDRNRVTGTEVQP